MALKDWNTSAADNASVAGINWAEGQAPSTVNNSAREEMAQVAAQYRVGQWAWCEESLTASVASQTTFKVATDRTTHFTAGRRFYLKSGSSTRFGSVVSASFTSETTVTCRVDSGSLSGSHSIVALGPAFVVGTPNSSPLPVESGTYTPTLTAVTNVDATTNGTGIYLRVGNVVHVAGQFDCDPTAATATVVGCSLPISSDIGAGTDLSGVVSGGQVTNGRVDGDSTNNRANLRFTAAGTTNATSLFTFTYRVI